MTVAQRKTRMTRQRKIILDVLRSTNSHPTADWIYERVRHEIPKVSLGTIYRNLRYLESTNHIQELKYGSSHSHFDGNPESHYHFVCRECGQIKDVPLELYRDIDGKAAEVLGDRVLGHRLEYYGICSLCKK